MSQEIQFSMSVSAGGKKATAMGMFPTFILILLTSPLYLVAFIIASNILFPDLMTLIFGGAPSGTYP